MALASRLGCKVLETHSSLDDVCDLHRRFREPESFEKPSYRVFSLVLHLALKMWIFWVQALGTCKQV